MFSSPGVTSYGITSLPSPGDKLYVVNDTKKAKEVVEERQTVARKKSLAERSPAIAEFFSNFSLTADDVSGFAFEISGNGRDAGEVAKEWVAANPKRVDAWLGL